MTPQVQDPHYPIRLADLPATWVETRVGEAIREIRSGFSSGQHTREARGIPHLRPMNIDRQGKINLSDLRYVPDVGGPRVRDGDLLFNNTNSRELVGKTAAIVGEGSWAFSNHMTRLRPPVGVSHRFTAYQLHFLWMSGYFRQRATQHVNQASISTTTLAQTVPFVLPPEGEQARIAAEIEKQFSRLEFAEAGFRTALVKIQLYRKSVLTSAAHGTLVPIEAELARQQGRRFESATELLDRVREESSVQRSSESQSELWNVNKSPVTTSVEQPYTLPDGWAWVHVQDVGEVRLGRQRSPQHHRGPNMRPYLRVANVFEDRIDTTDILQMNFTPEEFNLFRLDLGDILLNEGQSLELVGRPAMYRGEVPGACFQNTLIRFRSGSAVRAAYALLIFRYFLHSKRFQAIARWTTNIAHLGSGRFSQMKFPVPPQAEQDRIVAEAERCLSVVNAQEISIRSMLQRCATLRYAILAKAFSGKLVPQVHEEGSARELLDRIQDLPIPQADRSERIRRTATDKEPLEKTMKKRKQLYEVLVSAGGRLPTEELFRGSGFDDEYVDDFYDELRLEESRRRIRQDKLPDRSFVELVG